MQKVFMGFGKAIEYIENIGIENIEKYLKQLEEYEVFSKDKTIMIMIDYKLARFSDEIFRILNLENISVRAGHHCAMPLHRYIDEVSTLRLSFGIYTTKEEIDYVVEKLVRIGEMFNGNI